MSGPDPYHASFYSYMEDEAEASAGPVADLLLGWFDVDSVIDVGCGTGAWLAAFADRGVGDVLGVDQEAVPTASLRIPPERFTTVDLTDPPDVGRRFDLALCLEVGEHLPAETAAGLVRSLTSLAPIVVFSAAVPGQGGAGHVNEQWPAFWAERFEAEGYVCFDVLRRRLWDDERLAPFYRQNLLLYVDRAAVAVVPEEVRATSLPVPPLALVHPGTFDLVRTAAASRTVPPPSLSALLRALPGATSRAVRRRASALRG